MNPTETKNELQRILNNIPDDDSSMYSLGYAMFGILWFIIGFGLAFLIWGL